MKTRGPSLPSASLPRAFKWRQPCSQGAFRTQERAEPGQREHAWRRTKVKLSEMNGATRKCLNEGRGREALFEKRVAYRCEMM